MANLIIANLDCEIDFARAASPGPHKALPTRVQVALSHASLALEIFGTHRDSLWTLQPVQTRPASKHKMRLISGPITDWSSYQNILYWGQRDERNRNSRPPFDPTARWQDSMWHLHATANTVTAANDRRLCLQIPVDPQWLLAGTTIVSNSHQLDRYIANRPPGEDVHWVAKAPFAASGRERVCRQGRILGGDMRVRTERLLSRYGQLIIQPWVPRIADYGITGIIAPSLSDTRIFPPHRLYTSDAGTFRGIRIDDAGLRDELGPIYSRALLTTAELVATHLWELQYRGPFGVDSFTYTDQAGNTRLHSLCEINARMCFGLVARAHAEARAQQSFEFKPSLAINL